MHPANANVSTRSIHRFAIPTSLSTRYARDARSPRQQTSTIRPEGLVSGFALRSTLPRFVDPVTMPSMRAELRPVSKDGLLIHFMLFNIPIKFRPKVRLIVLNKRIPNLLFRCG
jgi:hypothetical protein